MRYHCSQAFLILDVQFRDDVSELIDVLGLKRGVTAC